MKDVPLYCPYDGMKLVDETCARCGRPKPFQPSATKWRKVLYAKQPFEDNYVNADFLQSLVTRETAKNLQYWDLTEHTTEITHVMCTLVLFFTTYHLCLSGSVSAPAFLAVEYTSLLGGYFAYEFLQRRCNWEVNTLLTGCILLGTLLSLCPVLATINRNYADDTIYLMVTMFTTLHAILYDYTFVRSEVPQISGMKHSDSAESLISLKSEISVVEITPVKPITPGIASMTCGFISALMLSSRLETTAHVFGLLSLAVIVYGLLPHFRRVLYRNSRVLYKFSSFALLLVNVALIASESAFLAFLIVALLIFIRYVCPLMLIAVYHYKNEVEGPWDLPKIKNYSMMGGDT